MAFRALIGGVQVDAILTGDVERAARVTSHPVEAGGLVSDHVILEPLTIRLEVSVGTVPASEEQRRADERRGVSERRWADVYARLVALFEARAPISVTMPLGTFDRMVISSLRTPDQANALRATLALQRVSFVTLATTRVRLARTASDRHRALARGGRVATPAATTAQQEQVERRESIAHRALRGLGAFR
jgi:hypothetical protein